MQLANAPDGCLWVVDMYRELIEGAAFLPPQILKHMDVASGVDRGRIWRIAPEGYSPRSPKLGKATTAELVALLEHPNGWHRDTASRLLYQRQDRSAIVPLRRLAVGSNRPIGRVQALGALAGLGAIEPDDVLSALGDPEPRVRGQALRLAEPFCRDSEPIRSRMVRMVDDPDPMVRYQLAFSLGALPAVQAASPLIALAVRDGADRWMRIAILSSVTGCTGTVFQRLADDAGFRGSKQGRTFLADLVGQTGVTDRPDDLAVILQALDGPLAADRALSRDIVLAMMSTDSAMFRAQLSHKSHGRVRSLLDDVLADARSTAVDGRKPAVARAAAVRSLRFAALPEVRAILTALLAPSQPLLVQAEAVATLARFDDVQVPEVLLHGWPQMSPKLRATAAEALFSRPAWVVAFLDAVEKGTIGRADVEPARLELLKSYPDVAIRTRATRIFAARSPGARMSSPPIRKRLRREETPARSGRLPEAVLGLSPPRGSRPAGRRRALGHPQSRPGGRTAQHPRPQPGGHAPVPQLRPRHHQRPRPHRHDHRRDRQQPDHPPARRA